MEVENNVNTKADLIEDEPQVKISKGKSYYYLGVLWLLLFFDIAVRSGITPLFPLIQKDLGLNDGQLGLIGSAVLLGITIFVIPISYLSDRWSKSKTISIMALIWSVCTALTGFASNLAAMVAARVGVGVGEASYTPTAVSLISSWFKKSKWGKMLAVFNSAQPIAAFAGVILAGFLASKFGWRTALIIFGIPSLFLGFLTLGMPENKTKLQSTGSKADKSKTSLSSSARLLFKNKTLFIMCLSNGLCTLVNVACQTWIPTYLMRYLNYTVTQTAIITGLIALAGVPAFAFGGYIIDKWCKKDLRSRMWFASICSILTSISFLIGIQLKIVPLFFVSMFLIFSAFPIAIAITSQEIVPHWNKTVSYGVMAFIAGIFGMLGPTLAGYFSQMYSLITAMSYMQILFIIGSIGFLIASITYMKDYNRAREEESEINNAEDSVKVLS